MATLRPARYILAKERNQIAVRNPPKPWDDATSSVGHLNTASAANVQTIVQEKDAELLNGHGRGAFREFDPFFLFRKTPEEFLVEVVERRRRLRINPLVTERVKQPGCIHVFWLSSEAMGYRTKVWDKNEAWADAVIPLDPDGGLDLRRVQKLWNLDNIYVWDQHKEEVFESADPDRLSPIAVRNLLVYGEQLYFLEFPSEEDLYWRERRRAIRAWIRDYTRAVARRAVTALCTLLLAAFALFYLHQYEWGVAFMRSIEEMWEYYEGRRFCPGPSFAGTLQPIWAPSAPDSAAAASSLNATAASTQYLTLRR